MCRLIMFPNRRYEMAASFSAVDEAEAFSGSNISQQKKNPFIIELSNPEEGFNNLGITVSLNH